ncbi:permease [Gilvimarinus sp. DA14]|uniref:permease n=1 Tax=Gilvimarinus sp. DA14 TaxID=2956798 RepID=UPI0020B775E3|nr:permease [Gilvimarinus sp. DA14]UTF61118.1 permease [Gilvimarinus sp. DA14]
MSEHCCSKPEPKPTQAGCCGAEPTAKKRPDFLLWGSLAGCVLLYSLYLTGLASGWLMHMAHGVFELLNTMWWGVVIGIVFVGLLNFVPQQLVVSMLGRGGSFSGILRATAAGVFLDLCSHGILMVGMKLYQKGASLGQVMAFLIASPWNSLSLTLVMIALIGLPWTLAFIFLSMVIAIIAGLVFDAAVKRRKLAANPQAPEQEAKPEPILPQLKVLWGQLSLRPQALAAVGREGLKGSRMVIRWLLFGVLLAAIIRALMPAEAFAEWFGPTLIGLLLTTVAAAVIEVCSEGSTPIAADLMNRAKAPGNSFLFLMAGVATDYTEIMVIKDTMKSWKTAFALPAIVLPQVLLVAWILNFFAV